MVGESDDADTAGVLDDLAIGDSAVGELRLVDAQLQQLLTTYGYYTGTIDGKYGPAPKNAVMASGTVS